MKPGYKQTEVGVIPVDWEVASIGAIASFKSGDGINVTALREESSDTPVPVYGGNGIAGYTGRALVQQRVVVVGRVGQKCGEVYLTDGPAWITDNALYSRIFFRKTDVRFLALALKGASLNGVRNRNDLPLITQSILHSVRIPLPPRLAEQEAIAQALSDAGVFIESLEQLIAKKRRIRRGVMQELLTGKRRLPGYGGEWGVKQLGDLVEIRKGELITEMDAVSGTIPVIAGGKKPAYFHNCANRSGKTITISGSGANAGYVAFYEIPIFASDCSTVGESQRYSVEFVYYALLLNQHAIYEAQTGGAQPHVHPSDLRPLLMSVPETKSEQEAIAAALVDMDAEIGALEERVAKTRQLKEGMVQELLTGRIRLV